MKKGRCFPHGGAATPFVFGWEDGAAAPTVDGEREASSQTGEAQGTAVGQGTLRDLQVQQRSLSGSLAPHTAVSQAWGA